MSGIEAVNGQPMAFIASSLTFLGYMENSCAFYLLLLENLY